MTRVDLIVIARQVVTCAPGRRPRPGRRMGDAGVLEEAAVAVLDGRIAAVGPASRICRRYRGDTLEYPDGAVVPGLVDCHTHPVFAGSRVEEFLLRSRGASYQEIHAAGGGILSTVRETRSASTEELERRLHRVLWRMIAQGTTTCEAKSGYGLETGEELRELRLLRRAGKLLPLDVVVTFLGAHAIPQEYRSRRGEFVDLVVEEMLPRVVAEDLADFADVFCEEGAFSLEESRRILTACRRAGLGLRIHAEEFHYLGGARMAAELGAASADHLQNLPEEDFEVLRAAGTIPVMTPGTSFFLGQGRYAPARSLCEADLPLALATDFNAGSCLTESMPMAMSLAVLRLGLTPEEALVAATVNAAHSLGLGDRVGSLEPGKQADLVVLDLPDWREWPYHFGVNLVRAVVKRGRPVRLPHGVPSPDGSATPPPPLSP